MTERIEATFRAIGLEGWLHAVDLDSGRELGLRPDEPVVLASVFKVALVTALYRTGLDLTQRVEIDARSGGPTGVSAMLDPVALSLRDLAYQALAVSDNAAADVLFDTIGDAPVAELLRALRLKRTRIPHRCRDMVDALVADAGVEDVQGWLEADPKRLARLSVRDPDRTNAGTARELTTLLAALWTDRAAAPESCAAIRRLMRLQLMRHRLASGFPDDVVAGKTGTLPGIRNEIGVVERTDGTRVAIAVFTRSDSPVAALPQADRAIGTAARIAADALRSRPGSPGRAPRAWPA